MPQNPRHSLSEKDLTERTAICAVCGPTGIAKKGTQWQCRTVHRAQRRRDMVYKRYGLSRLDYEALLIAQSGLCAICDCQLRDPHVDHCHTTGAVRGLLCTGCNKGLGNFQDNPRRLVAAIDYLVNSGAW